jgi:hypothetical protein
VCECRPFDFLEHPERRQRAQEPIEDIRHRLGACREDIDWLRLVFDEVGYPELRDHVEELRPEEPEQEITEKIIGINARVVAHRSSMT